MEFRILGPLEVWDGPDPIRVGGPKVGALLAVLLLHPNEVVASDRLMDELWPDEERERAGAALRVNVSRLRKMLPADVLMTRPPGYLVRVEPGQLDLERFERLGGEGRILLDRGHAAEAADRLREALSLWRGPALAEFTYETFAQPAIARLEEIRLATVELRIDAEIALGRHDNVIAELDALITAHPFRERLRIQLMTALYRAGRQADALRAYRDARLALTEELGIEPTPALRELEGAILRHDPSLVLNDVSAAAAGHPAERSILLVADNPAGLVPLLAVAEPLVRRPPRVLVLARLVADADQLGPTSTWLQERRAQLERSGVIARAVSFTSSDPGHDAARLAADLDVDLLLASAPAGFLADGVPDRAFAAILAEAPCDVAVLARPDPLRPGPVLVPFGGADHDWAAVELGAWLARSTGSPLRLAGTAAVPEHGKRDASRLLAHGALAVQRVLGISAEPLLVPPGDDGILEASRDAGVLVVGLSARWHHDELGPARLRLAREATPPTLLVRRGLRPGGLAPPAALTRFTWSIAPPSVDCQVHAGS
jgi:DNA-binding SARP family transcriptional activator